MPRKVLVNEVSLRSDGSISVQLLKQVTDGGDVVSEQPHRFSISPGDDMAAQFATVNAHLADMGYPEMDPKELDRVKKIDAIGKADRAISIVKGKR